MFPSTKMRLLAAFVGYATFSVYPLAASLATSDVVCEQGEACPPVALDSAPSMLQIDKEKAKYKAVTSTSGNANKIVTDEATVHNEAIIVFDSIDQDHDGGISILEAEARGYSVEQFQWADRNSNGKVSLEEVASLFSKHASGFHPWKDTTSTRSTETGAESTLAALLSKRSGAAQIPVTTSVCEFDKTTKKKLKAEPGDRITGLADPDRPPFDPDSGLFGQTNYATWGLKQHDTYGDGYYVAHPVNFRYGFGSTFFFGPDFSSTCQMVCGWEADCIGFNYVYTEGITPFCVFLKAYSDFEDASYSKFNLADAYLKKDPECLNEPGYGGEAHDD